MPRPTTKEQLLKAGDENFSKLFALIDSMPRERQEQEFDFEGRDRSIRDVLVHLYEWHRLLIHWACANRAGDRVSFLPGLYTWKTYPQMNVRLWEKHQATPLDDAVAMLKQSHAEVMELIGSFSDEELFTKKYFPWTGTTNLGSYCVSAAPSHYDWAIKKIKAHLKSLK